MDVNESSHKIQELEAKILELEAKLSQQQESFRHEIDDLTFYYESILSSIPGHIYWMDTNGHFIGCNELQAKHSLMDNPQALVGKSLYDILPVEIAKKLNETNQYVLETQQSLIVEESASFLYDGGVYLSHKTPLFDQSKKLIGLVGVSLNITEQKKIEKELLKAKEKAEHLTKAQSMFIANMSHDIRTPLSGIIGMAQLLKKEITTASGNEYLQYIYDCSEELLKLMNGFLDVMSLDHLSEERLLVEQFSLTNIMQDIKKLQQPLLQNKQLLLDIDLDPSIPQYLLGDSTKLHRILLNLMGNAIKFTHKGGVCVSINLKEETDSSCCLHFCVADTGIGIPADMLDKIFDRFFRLTPSAQREYDGYGIGLSLVKNYVELLGGTIQVTSQENKGSTFEFSLSFEKIDIYNLKYQKTIGTDDVHQPGKLDYSNLNILFVEDNKISMRYLENFARQLNCNYVKAYNAEDALAFIPQHYFDVIVTDIGLPGMSGMELARKVRQCADIRQPMMIGLSAYVSPSIVATSQECGMNVMLSKPISFAQLKNIIKTTMEREGYLHPCL